MTRFALAALLFLVAIAHAQPPGKGGRPPRDDAPPTNTTAKAAFGTIAETPAPPVPGDLKPIGGRWYVREGVTSTYFYRDADRFLDLFAGQIGDSNGDGIPDLRLSHDSKFLILDSQNLPNHPHAKFPNSGNPNSIQVQKFKFRLPLVPKPAAAITAVPMGPAGVAINGVVYFNPFEMGGMNAVAGYSEIWLDSCCGHPQQSGVYHYHKYPSCLKTPFLDDGDGHSPVIGFAWDGYPVYGPYVAKGIMARDLTGADALDVCNGRFDPERGYHYHVTPGRFPYIIGGYAGVVEPSNGRGLSRGSMGALIDNTTGEGRQGAGVLTVKPGTASRGQAHAIHITLATGTGRHMAAPDVAPSRVFLGPFEVTGLARTGDAITGTVTIPADANRGALHDCHLEFPSSGRDKIIVLKKNAIFRVVE